MAQARSTVKQRLKHRIEAELTAGCPVGKRRPKGADPEFGQAYAEYRAEQKALFHDDDPEGERTLPW